MDKNVVSVKIAGKQYSIKGKESVDYLFSVGMYVDKAISELQKAAPSLSTEEAAVLASLNFADELIKQRRIAGEWDVTKYRMFTDR